MRRWLEQTEACRRLELQCFLDGRGTDCLSLSSGASMCDICTRRLDECAETAGFEEEEEVEEEWEEAAPTNVILDAHLSNRNQNDLLMDVLRLKQWLHRFNQQCILCFATSSNTHHEDNLSKCPRMIGRCLKCLTRGHSTRQCPHRITFPTGVCFACGLPNRIASEFLHINGEYGRCDSGGKDRILPLCWYIWHREDYRGKMLDHFRVWDILTSGDFAVWLGTDNSGLCNSARLFSWFFESFNM